MSASPQPLRAYLVDDEPLALKRISKLLVATRRIEIAGKTTDPEAAMEFLNSESIDVLFLDIQMPGMNGFDLLEKLSTQPMVIFTTAHDKYALGAFKVNSIDYLLKPIEPRELDRALDKLERLRSSGVNAQLQIQLRAAIENAAATFRGATAAFPARVASRVGGKIQFVDLNKVTHFQAEEKLTYAVTATKQYVVDHTIVELEQKLDRKQFVRIHRATLVNLAWVDEVHAWFGGRLLVRLKGEKAAELTVARDRARELKESLGI